MHNYYVYILFCNDGTYYTGVTNNVIRRFKEHCEGRDPGCYTAKRRPVALVHVERFQWILDAIAREKQIKGWTVKKKKALIMSNAALLHELARCRNESSHTNNPASSDETREEPPEENGTH